ncbi:helix-turn-helix domain-containing protein [Microbulbifer sp. ARAS458-1]|uniref:helix-turn-helix domain-containing protein n=1 Tax=Microbulbifer sp. ARAS458-1 TaxID=3140242 RepID=UPI00387818EC
MKPIERAIKVVGTQEQLAHALGLKYQSSISQWVTGRRPVPPMQCLPIEKATGGAVTRYELRPDVFGPAPDGELKKAG